MPLVLDGKEGAGIRFAIFDETDVFDAPLIGVEDSHASIENIWSFGNSELVTTYVHWQRPARDDGRWMPMAYLFNANFRNLNQPEGDKILELKLVANYALDIVDG